MTSPTSVTVTVAYDPRTSDVVGLEVRMAGPGIAPDAISEAIRTAFQPLGIVPAHERREVGSATVELSPRWQ